MNELIQFILKNFFVVIVIVGFIVSLLNKARKGSTPNNRMPDFGGGPLIPQAQRQKPLEQRPANRPAAQPAAASTVRPATLSQSSYRGMSSEEGESMEYPPSSQIPAEERAPTLRRNLTPEHSSVPTVSQDPAPFRLPVDELRRAVVLAEVLGPPRSKRPLGRQ
ncbi:hypothetical protein KZ483_20080 [Paenibacillus sp. sptzw28]|uniref:hypothetical protein n=1 Tax=Paenibacillus sp. sptzw28 TaxID=715179 RepID=UPI001C6E3B7A|nr:hypothetical protein [Paenibacillus sp. sptzw28]QYR20140.1 hypothetical protein KZ483_20080 [Paenibacillus sp. sptzw28]